jgi:hypothetical protein
VFTTITFIIQCKDNYVAIDFLSFALVPLKRIVWNSSMNLKSQYLPCVEQFNENLKSQYLPRIGCHAIARIIGEADTTAGCL